MKRMMKNTPVKATILILAVLMRLFSGVQTTRAALSYQSNDYQAKTSMKSINISLVENGNEIGDGGQLLTGPLKVMDAKGDVTEAESEFRYGVTYAEDLAAKNSGEIAEYARVIVTRYWLQDGKTEPDKANTDPSLDPRLIKLHLTGNWINGGMSASGERIILYYPGVLDVGASSSFIDAFQVDGSLAIKATTTDVDESGRIKITYEYDGREFVIAAEAQCVQTHNAQQAITSAWGSDAWAILSRYVSDSSTESTQEQNPVPVSPEG